MGITCFIADEDLGMLTVGEYGIVISGSFEPEVRTLGEPGCVVGLRGQKPGRFLRAIPMVSLAGKEMEFPFEATPERHITCL
jgi:hypothetical protein